MPSATVVDWIAAGRPTSKAWSQRTGYREVLGPVPPGFSSSWMCSASKERMVSVADREAWYRLKPGCRAQYEKTSGLKYSPSAGGFLGSGAVDPGDAFLPAPPRYVEPPYRAFEAPVPITTQQVAPTGPTSGGSKVSSYGFNPFGQGTNPGIGINVGGVDVGYGPGGATIGGVPIPGSGSWGGSKCKGPYNYNPVTGRCDPKPGVGFGETTGSPGVQPTGLTGGGPCPTGYEWDGSTCRRQGFIGTIQQALPGGNTGTGVDVYGEATIGSFGMPALVPFTEAVPVNRCPPGAVLGKDNLCYMKGSIPNRWRKWPKPPRPALTAGDMKTLRRAETLKNRVSRAAMSAGFKKPQKK